MSCGKRVMYTGELSRHAMELLSISLEDAIEETHPDGLCDDCADEMDMAVVESVMAKFAG